MNFILKIKNTIRSKKIEQVQHLWINYIVSQWKLLLLSSIFMLMFGILNACAISLLKPVFDEVFIDKNKSVLIIMAIKLVIVFATKSLAQYIQAVTMIKLGINCIKKLQLDLYRKIIIQDLDFFHKHSSGNLLVHFERDLTTIKEAIIITCTTLVRDTCSIVFLIILMFLKSFDMAIIMFIFFPLGFYPILYFGKKIKKIFHKQQGLIGNLYTTLTQSFCNIKIVKAYNMENIEFSKLKLHTDKISKTALKIAKNSNILSPLMEFFGGVVASATLTYGGYRIIHGLLTPGEFMIFLVSIIAIYQPMKSLANLSTNIQIGIVALGRIFNLMDIKPQIVNKLYAKKIIFINGVIKFNKVKFSYVPNRTVLHNINLVVKEGEKVAIVGRAGSGKSTCMNLLLRFYDVQDGSIEIDGEDIRNIQIQSLRDNISFVSQDIMLFDNTIRDNILIGRPNASNKEMIAAAKNAAAHDFITSQETGYSTIIGQHGVVLSGGQKQMIALARAILKNAPILLLDEATSSLDFQSEKKIQQCFDNLIKDKTAIVIAHRLSTIMNADRIYVFKNGYIVEVGTHEKLMNLNGHYANLYKYSNFFIT
ncbi:MAG: ABC transporter ATP-binding protein/permease [Endomicrobium sp.]|jgi:subfamily B ATP-binding cassette protein MsbA|nr:ABC transporter ATP-binding protein/permease [Endomicrobium sp.]